MSGQRRLALVLMAVWVLVLALAMGASLTRLSPSSWGIPSGAGRSLAGNLPFQTYYTHRFQGKMDLLLTRLVEGRPRRFGGNACHVGLALAYSLMMGLFLWQGPHVVLEEGRS